MNIAVIGAMKEELRYFLMAIDDKKEEQLKSGLTVTKGMLFDHQIFIIQSGIGKVNAAVHLTELLVTETIDLIINIGSAGGIHSEMEIGDVAIATGVRFHDVDVRAFGYASGQVPGMPETFEALEKYMALTDATMNLTGMRVHKGVIATGDQFVENGLARMELLDFSDVIAIEMEAAAIAQTAHIYNTDWIIIRSISDVANKDSATSFSDFLDTAAKNAAMFLVEFLKAL